MKRFILTAIIISLSLVFGASPGRADGEQVVLLEDDTIVGDDVRLSYPVLLSNERGYRIRCAAQAHEEAVIRGLGFLGVPSSVLTAVDPLISAAGVLENPLLCPAAADYAIKVFAHNGPAGLTHYLQFPSGLGSTSFTDRIYIPGCAGLVEALALDLDAALDADPTPFFTGKIHEIGCLVGEPIQTTAETFSDWCVKTDRTAAETTTVMALLDSTPGGVAALGDPVACGAAQLFLQSVTALNLSGFGISALEPVSVLGNLNSLTLANNDITEIGPLAALPAALFLDLSGNRISNLATLAALTTLTDLKLEGNEVEDLRPVATLAGLTSLELGDNDISDVGPLEFNQALQALDLSGNQLTGDALEPLTGLGALTSLDLSNNLIETFEHLGQFPSTTQINLAGNPILGSEVLTFLDICILHREEPTPYGFTIRAMVEVTQQMTCEAAAAALNASPVLDLSGTSISDLQPVGFIENLTTLDLSANSIVDVSPLAGMTGLSSLDLSGNNISDIRPVGPLVALTSFSAADNPVQVDDYLSACLMGDHEEFLAEDQQLEMEALLGFSAQDTCFASEDWLKRVATVVIREAGLRTVDYFAVAQNARQVDLGSNELTDVSALRDLPLLTFLRLESNQLADLTSLLPLRGLENLRLDENPLTSLSGVQVFDKLKWLDIDGTQVTFIRPLNSLPALEWAGLQRLNINYSSFEDYCLVHKYGTTALGSERAFMTALDDRIATAGPDAGECATVTAWVNSLEVLSLNKKNLTSITPVRMFRNLKEVHFFDNRITDASPLVHLTNLEKVNLAKNQLRGFPVLRSTRLKTLYLNLNQIPSSTPFQSKTSLETLRLDDNLIQNSSPLQSLANLRYLDLRNNRLAAFSLVSPIFQYNPYLKGNPICPASPEIHVPVQLMQACTRDPRMVVLNINEHVLLNDLVLNVSPPPFDRVTPIILNPPNQ